MSESEPTAGEPSTTECIAARFARVEEMLAGDPATSAHGLHPLQLGDHTTVVTMRVRPVDANGYGVCHGGIVFLLADTTAAFASNAREAQTVWITSGANATFVKPAHVGDLLRAECVLRWSGGTRRRIYDVTITNDGADTLALVQVQMSRTRPAD